LREACADACGTVDHGYRQHWISEKSLELIDARRKIPSDSSHNKVRRDNRKNLKRSLIADREAWLSEKASEMEAAFASGNIRRLFQLIRSTGSKRSLISETIKETDGTLIHNKSRRLTRRSEYFEGQFSWPPACTTLPPHTSEVTPWSVNLEPPTLTEVRDCLTALKRFKAAGPDNLMPPLFKDGGEVLAEALTKLFELVWNTENVPDNWGESIIVPIFKKGDKRLCENHRGISLTPVITRILASIILRRLTAARETDIREEQAGFRPGRGCVDHIFTLRQILEQRHSVSYTHLTLPTTR
jgi:hypothetical protein